MFSACGPFWPWVTSVRGTVEPKGAHQLRSRDLAARARPAAARSKRSQIPRAGETPASNRAVLPNPVASPAFSCSNFAVTSRTRA
jgi:hypothetical protein